MTTNRKHNGLLKTRKPSTTPHRNSLSEGALRLRRFTPQPGLRRTRPNRLHPTQRAATTRRGTFTRTASTNQELSARRVTTAARGDLVLVHANTCSLQTSPSEPCPDWPDLLLLLQCPPLEFGEPVFVSRFLTLRSRRFLASFFLLATRRHSRCNASKRADRRSFLEQR